MKKQLKTILLSAALTAALAVSASASSFDHCADKLNDLGLFQGTANGYELDTRPTRAHAAAMLVRLLGAEEEALELTYTAPYTDLVGWEAPYVQYLYEHELTTGTSATRFSPTSDCSSQMYTTFLLRALGYSEAEGDFTYNDAVAKARELGLADYANLPQSVFADTQPTFLRDNVVALSYTALNTSMADDADTTLLEKLVEDGAVDRTKAAAQLSEFAAYDDYAAATEAFSKETKMDMTVSADATVRVGGTQFMTMSMPMNMQMDMDMTNLNNSKIAMTGKTTITLNELLVPSGESATQTADMSMYYTNGVAYVETDGEKVQMPMSFAGMQDQIGSMTEVASEPISMIKSVSKSGDVYTVNYQMNAIGGMVNEIMGAMSASANATDMTLGDVTAKITVANKRMTRMDMTMKMSMKVEGQTMDMDMVMNYVVNKSGSGVTVTLPTDLSGYTPAAA